MAEVVRLLSKAARLALDGRFRRALIRGVGAADHQLPVLRSLAPRPSLVVDVGAHRGQFLLAALAAFPGVPVVSVEPQPASLARLRSWLDRSPPADRDRVVLHRVALSDHAGTAVLHVARSDDNSSLRLPTRAQTSLFPQGAMTGSLEVPLARLDTLLDPAALGDSALLKVDVQGSELEVLDGAGDLLPRFRWVYVECSEVELYEGQALADAVVSRLAAAGFTLAGRHNALRGPDGGVVQADYLFARPGAA